MSKVLRITLVLCMFCFCVSEERKCKFHFKPADQTLHEGEGSIKSIIHEDMIGLKSVMQPSKDSWRATLMIKASELWYTRFFL